MGTGDHHRFRVFCNSESSTAPVSALSNDNADPHFLWRHEWKAAEAEWSRLERRLDDIMLRSDVHGRICERARGIADEAHQHQWDLLKRLCEIPAQSLHGLRVQVDVLAEMLATTGPSWDEDLDILLVRNIRSALDRIEMNSRDERNA